MKNDITALPDDVPRQGVVPSAAVYDLTAVQTLRATGSMLGGAVGDALGAPFEFGAPRAYSTTFPEPVLAGRGEMIGGGGFGWAPGEFTDDTQMALALAASIEEARGFDPAVTWRHFRAWAQSATDIGNTTREALSHADWEGAAERAHEKLNGRTASNGSVMRIAPVGVRGVVLGQAGTYHLAVAQSRLTHFDDEASYAAALVAEVVRGCVLTGAFEESLANARAFLATTELAAVGARFDAVLASTFDPTSHSQYLAGGARNGAALVAVAQAVWALRGAASFHDAVVRAIDLGGDTDTVGAICGTMAGAVFCQQAIPARWASLVRGSVLTPDGVREFQAHDVTNTARRLLGVGEARLTPPEEPFGPMVVAEVGGVRVMAANVLGAATTPEETGVVTLCFTGHDLFTRHQRRTAVFMRDEEGGENPELGFALREAVDAVDALIAGGRDVVVHCHGGRSRTTFVLRAWYMRRFGVDHGQAREWMKQWPLFAPYNQTFNRFLDAEWHAASWGRSPA